MKKGLYAALALTSIIGASVQAQASQDDTASSCFLNSGNLFTSYGSTYQMDSLTIGIYHNSVAIGKGVVEKREGNWLLDQGISNFTAQTDSEGVTLKIEFPATHSETTSYDQNGSAPLAAFLYPTYTYFNVSAQSSVPVVSELDNETQNDVFRGKAVFCNAQGFIAVMSDHQLFTKTSNRYGNYRVGARTGLLFHASVDKEAAAVSLSVTSLGEALNVETPERLKSIKLNLFETFPSVASPESDEAPVITGTFASHQGINTASKYVSAMAYTVPQLAKNAYGQASDTASFIAELPYNSYVTAESAAIAGKDLAGNIYVAGKELAGNAYTSARTFFQEKQVEAAPYVQIMKETAAEFGNNASQFGKDLLTFTYLVSVEGYEQASNSYGHYKNQAAESYGYYRNLAVSTYQDATSSEAVATATGLMHSTFASVKDFVRSYTQGTVDTPEVHSTNGNQLGSFTLNPSKTIILNPVLKASSF